MQVLVIRGRRVNSLLLAQERSKGLLLHEGFRDRVAATKAKAKAKISHPKMGNTLELLTSQGESVFPMPLAGTLETGFPSEAGIPELWDTIVLVINGSCTDIACSSLPRHGPRKTISVLRCCTNTYYFADRPHGLGHGPTSRTGLIDRDFKDPGACLCHYTSD